jgi:hypothetical protein
MARVAAFALLVAVAVLCNAPAGQAFVADVTPVGRARCSDRIVCDVNSQLPLYCSPPWGNVAELFDSNANIRPVSFKFWFGTVERWQVVVAYQAAYTDGQDTKLTQIIGNGATAQTSTPCVIAMDPASSVASLTIGSGGWIDYVRMTMTNGVEKICGDPGDPTNGVSATEYSINSTAGDFLLGFAASNGGVNGAGNDLVQCIQPVKARVVGYVGKWVQVASGSVAGGNSIQHSFTQGVTFTDSRTLSQTEAKTITKAMSFHVGMELHVSASPGGWIGKAMGLQMDFKANMDYSTSLTDTATSVVSSTTSSSVTKLQQTSCLQTCVSSDLRIVSVNMYQWVVESSDGAVLVQTCNYWCRSEGGPPQCPVGSCVDAECSFCKRGTFSDKKIDDLAAASSTMDGSQAGGAGGTTSSGSAGPAVGIALGVVALLALGVFVARRARPARREEQLVGASLAA